MLARAGRLCVCRRRAGVRINPPAAAATPPAIDEDVQCALIAAGISLVLTAVNLDDIEEQQDFVERLTGRRKRVRTVPQEFP